MNEVGARYSTELRGSLVVIDQIGPEKFELLVERSSKGFYPTPKAAREKIISVLLEQTSAGEVEIRNEVPMLGNWETDITLPFDPEENQ